jgi:hypothetical protein
VEGSFCGIWLERIIARTFEPDQIDAPAIPPATPIAGQ